jgi:hypothetical protein
MPSSSGTPACVHMTSCHPPSGSWKLKLSAEPRSVTSPPSVALAPSATSRRRISRNASSLVALSAKRSSHRPFRRGRELYGLFLQLVMS